ncbi:hypothetical protein HKA99_32035, partial [Vibrio parahaemolyticus]|nr:hypothetical protein [Vibrio parahaemolyticus]
IDAITLKLPRHRGVTYLSWKEGYCLKTTLPKNTFYRHRRELQSNVINWFLLTHFHTPKVFFINFPYINIKPRRSNIQPKLNQF